MLTRALESFHPLHVGLVWISNPRYTYARGNEKSPVLTRALESFHPLHVGLVWISNPRYTYARGKGKRIWKHGLSNELNTFNKKVNPC